MNARANLGREGGICGRQNCVTCTQGGEATPNCTKRSVVYENVCLLCNPTARENKDVVPQASHPTIYVGESARSVAERAENH